MSMDQESSDEHVKWLQRARKSSLEIIRRGDRMVVIKTVRNREWAAKTIAALKAIGPCETIIELLHYYSPKPRCYHLELEYCENGDLFDYIIANRKKRHDIPWVTQIVYDVTNALKCVHAAGIIHRDVKPENVLLWDNYRRAKLCDFDFCEWIKDTPKKVSANRKRLELKKFFDEGEGDCSSSMEKDKKRVKGTKGFVAPEIYETTTATAASDMFSLGVMIHDCMALRHHRHCVPSRCAIKYPEARELVESLCSADPNKRPTAEDVLQNGWLNTWKRAALKANENFSLPKE